MGDNSCLNIKNLWAKNVLAKKFSEKKFRNNLKTHVPTYMPLYDSTPHHDCIVAF
jgi:hypothetical protein